MHRRILAVLTLTLVLLTGTQAAPQKSGSDFFLRNNDTVVFYGDSITEQLMYGRDIENFVVTRYPKLNVKFINSGWSGDTVGGGGGGPIDVRLKRDVLPYKPTVVTILLGMNDGGYHADDAPTFTRYTSGLTHIVETLQKSLPGVRLVLLTPTFFDANHRTDSDPNAPHNYQHPDLAYNQTLIKYGDWIKAYAASHHLLVADLNAPMAAAVAEGRKTDPNFTLAADGVHPNEVGHLIMASAVLTAWNAQPIIADISLTPVAPPSTLNQIPSTPSPIGVNPLPWPVPDAARPAFAVSPLPAELTVFRLRGLNLSNVPNYTLVVDGKPAGMVTKEQLTTGIDLTQSGDLPWNSQAQETAGIIQQRTNIWHNLYKGSNDAITRPTDAPSKNETTALTSLDKWLDEWREKARAAAQPKPHTIELCPIGQ